MTQTTNLFRWELPRRLFASILAVCMVFTMSPPIMVAQANETDGGEGEIVLLSGFAQLADEVAAKAVPIGTSSVELKLPDTLEATAYTVSKDTQPPTEQHMKSTPELEPIVENHVPTKTITVSGVTWDSAPEYDSKTEGKYILTTVLPHGYMVEDGVSLPTITVTVGKTEPSPVDRVIAMIDVLPSTDEWMAMEETAARGVMSDILAAKSPYDKLTDDEKAQIDEVRTVKLTELAEMAAGLASVMPMAVGEFITDSVSIGGKERDITFRIISDPNGSTNGTVKIYKEDSQGYPISAIDSGSAGDFNLTVGFSHTKGTFDVTEIGESAFMNRSGLTGDLSIPKPITAIGKQAFYGCSGFTGSLEIGPSVTSIGEEAFRDCYGFTGALTLPNNVTSIGKSAFWGCNGFTGALTLPNNVTSIADSAFWGCNGLTGKLTIPNSVTSIGNSAFYNCPSFTGTLTLPTNVKSIGESAFYGCTGFAGTLTIPTTVESIGESAFYGCTGLTGTLTIPDSVTSIGKSAFFNNRFTGNLAIPSSVKTIGDSAFKNCETLTSVTALELETIGSETFGMCKNLTSVTAPKVVTIEDDAFFGSSALATLTLAATPPTATINSFRSCPTTRALVLVDENGTALTGSALAVAFAAYKAVNDGNTADKLWYGWKIPEPPSYKVTITTKKDNKTWSDHGKTYKLSKDGGQTFATSLTAVVDGEYDIYEGTTNTGEKVTVNGGPVTAIMNYYTVTFYDNLTPYTAPAPQIVLKGGKATEPAPPTKRGYTLEKWVTENGGVTQFVFANEAITTITPVYASWTANTYTVTFQYQDGTGTPQTKTVTFDSYYGELPIPEKAGYTFKGWYTKATGGTLVTANVQVAATANHTLYAYWADEIAPSAPVLQDGTTLPTDWTNAQTTLPLTLSDNVGVTQLWVKMDTADFTQVTAFTSGNTSYVYKAAEGTHTYQFKALDAAGNESTSDVFTVKLDTAAPVVDTGSITVTNGSKDLWNWIIGKTSLIIKVPVTDETSGVKSVSYTAAPDSGDVITGIATLTAGICEIVLGKEFSGTVKLTATDNTDNATADVSLTAGNAKIVAEDTAPVITITEPDTGKNTDDWYSAAFDLDVTVADGENGAISSGIKRIAWKLGDTGEENIVADLPGAAATYHKTFKINVSTNGTHTYLVKATDNAGNETAWQTITVKLDAVKPGTPSVEAMVDGAAYDGTFTAKTVTMTATAAAETLTSGVTLQHKIAGGGWQAYTLPIAHNTNTSIGGLVYTFRTLSGAGIASEEQTVTVKRQALSDDALNDAGNKYASGDITVGGTPNERGWHKENVTVTVTPKYTIRDGEASYTAETYYTIDNGAPIKLAAPWEIPVTGDKEHKLEIWTQDVAGNETTHLPVTVKIDATAPVISDPLTPSVAAGTWTKDDITVSFTASDETAGVASVAVNPEGAVTEGPKGSYTFTASENGTYTVTVTDNAGTSTQKAITIENIDKTAPTLSITPTFDSTKWYGATEITVAVTDDGSDVDTITVSGGNFTNEDIKTAGKFTAMETVVKSYTYTVTATDTVENSTSATVTISLDSRIDIFLNKMAGKDEQTSFSDLAAVKDWYDSQNIIVQSHIKSNDKANELLENLNKWLTAQAQAAADALGEAVRNANTIEKIEQVQKDYDALPHDIKKSVSSEIVKELDKKSNDADVVQKVIAQLENAIEDRATYEEKHSAKEAYDKLTDAQKSLVPEKSIVEYNSIKADLAAINTVLDLLKDIKKPYTADTVGEINGAETAYNMLSVNNKAIFPGDEKTRLDKLTDMASRATTVKDLIDALVEEYNKANDEAIKTAKAAYDKLTDEEKNLIDNTLKTKLDNLYKAMLDDKTAEEKAKMETEKQFVDKVNDTIKNPTLDKINQLITAKGKLPEGIFDALIDDVKNDYNDLVASKDVIKALDLIDLSKLTPDDMGKVNEVLGGYDVLTDHQKKLVDVATDDKPAILRKALREILDVSNKINDIPDHNTDGYDPETGAPDLGECDSQIPAEGGSIHDYETHRTAIETAKIAYEKLSDPGRRLISEDAKTKLNGEYAGLMTYLEYINTAKTTSTSVEVAGLAENVQLPADSAAAAKTVLSVVMKDERPKFMPPTPVGKNQVFSVDIKLVAEIYNNMGDEKPSVTENVQPAAAKKVLIKLKIPTGFHNNTLELWHVKDNGAGSRITNFWLVTESDGVYGVFEVSSFSHFVFFAESQSSGGTSLAPQPKIVPSDNGSIEITPKGPYIGDRVTITPKPDMGYVVDTIIVTDSNGKEIPVAKTQDGKFTFIQPSSRVTITTTFKSTASLPFTDVQTDDWFYNTVKYTFDKGLMQGTSDTTFSPNAPTSRGMIATILHRMEGMPNVGSPSFSDVEPSTYYADGVAWAQAAGVVKGYDNGNFGPNDNITREQFAAILYRYAKLKDYEYSKTATLDGFVDYECVSGYAKDMMGWAVGNGIISGRGDNTLAPTAIATRAEVATILFRFNQLVVK